MEVFVGSMTAADDVVGIAVAISFELLDVAGCRSAAGGFVAVDAWEVVGLGTATGSGLADVEREWSGVESLTV